MRTRNTVFARFATCIVFAGATLAIAPACAAARFPAGAYASEGSSVTLTFDDKGNVRVKKGDELEVEGSYAFKADQVELTDNSGPWACTEPGQKSGTYRWTYDKGMLTFSIVADKCKGRSEDLTGKSWKKN